MNNADNHARFIASIISWIIIIRLGSDSWQEFFGKAFNPYYKRAVNTEAIMILALLLIYISVFCYLNISVKKNIPTQEEEEDEEEEEPVLKLMNEVYTTLMQEVYQGNTKWEKVLGRLIFSIDNGEIYPQIMNLMTGYWDLTRPETLSEGLKNNFRHTIIGELEACEDAVYELLEESIFTEGNDPSRLLGALIMLQKSAKKKLHPETYGPGEDNSNTAEACFAKIHNLLTVPDSEGTGQTLQPDLTHLVNHYQSPALYLLALCADVVKEDYDRRRPEEQRIQRQSIVKELGVLEPKLVPHGEQDAEAVPEEELVYIAALRRCKREIRRLDNTESHRLLLPGVRR